MVFTVYKYLRSKATISTDTKDFRTVSTKVVAYETQEVKTLDITKCFAAISRQTQIFYTRELMDANISYGQMMFIICICDKPGLSQDEIAAEMLLDKSTVARAVKQLTENDLVIRAIDNNDKRKHHIYPTEKALLLYDRMFAVREKWHSRLTRH